MCTDFEYTALDFATGSLSVQFVLKTFERRTCLAAKFY